MEPAQVTRAQARVRFRHRNKAAFSSRPPAKMPTPASPITAPDFCNDVPQPFSVRRVQEA
jgi:hypothetical protein